MEMSLHFPKLIVPVPELSFFVVEANLLAFWQFVHLIRSKCLQ
jgi:hypothetical protein